MLYTDANVAALRKLARGNALVDRLCGARGVSRRADAVFMWYCVSNNPVEREAAAGELERMAALAGVRKEKVRRWCCQFGAVVGVMISIAAAFVFMPAVVSFVCDTLMWVLFAGVISLALVNAPKQPKKKAAP